MTEIQLCHWETYVSFLSRGGELRGDHRNAEATSIPLASRHELEHFCDFAPIRVIDFD
ncbi:MAG: hypothetical protein ABGX07_08060 [Pirellulaceae bacterium]|jgi:hypothetical protein